MRRLLIVLPLIALALLAWLFLRESRDAAKGALEPSQVEDRSGAEQSGTDTPDIALEADAVHEPERIAAAEPVPPEKPALPADSELHVEPDSPWIVARFVSAADRKPMSGVRARVQIAASDEASWSHIAGPRGDMSHAPISDAEGRVEIAVTRGVELVVHLGSETRDTCGSAEALVPALAARERREIEITIPCGADGRLFGLVIDRETKMPVTNALVRLMRITGSSEDESGEWVSTGKELTTRRTDANGAFDLEFSTWMQPYLRIEADGFGLRYGAPRKDRERPDRPQTFFVSRAGTLRATVLDAAGKPIAGSSLRLKAHGYDLDATEEDEDFGTWAAYPDERFTASLGADGRCTIPGLPARVMLAIEILEGGRLLRREADPMQLQPGETVERTWTIGAGARIEGSMVDQHNAPVARQAVWLLKAPGPVASYMEDGQKSGVVGQAKTDADGRFVIDDVVAGSYWIGPAPNLQYGRVPKPEDVAAKAQALDVAGGGVVTVRVVVTRGLTITGTVLDPDGKPVSDARIGCTQGGWWIGIDARTDATGAFTLGPFAPGTCKLWADQGSHATSEHVDAEPGQKDVVLRLQSAGRISGRAIDASTGKPCAATVHVQPDHVRGTPMGAGFQTEIHDDGVFQLEGLVPDGYSLSFWTNAGGFALVTGIQVLAGQESSGHVATLEPGGKIAMRYDGSASHVRWKLVRTGAQITFEGLLLPGKTETRPVPAGSVTLEYAIGENGATRKLKVDIDAGATREVLVKDDV